VVLTMSNSTESVEVVPETKKETTNWFDDDDDDFLPIDINQIVSSTKDNNQELVENNEIHTDDNTLTGQDTQGDEQDTNDQNPDEQDSNAYVPPNRRNGYDRKERVKIPPPDVPPFTAKLNNLSYNASEDDLREFFGELGLKSVKIIREHKTNKSKGFGYIEFDTKKGLEDALQADKNMLLGRELEVSVWVKKEDTGNRNNYRTNKYNGSKNRNNNKPWTNNNNRREENNKTRGGWTTRGGKRSNNNQRTGSGFSLTSKVNNPNQSKEEKEQTKSKSTSFNPYDLLLGDEDTNINNDD